MSTDTSLGFFATDVSLTDTAAIVTGSSRGIGRAIAIELARQGADVLINYNQNRSAAVEVRHAVAALGRKSAIVQADISDLQAHQKMLDTALDAFGKVDILINNAGITRIADILEETPRPVRSDCQHEPQGTALPHAARGELHGSQSDSRGALSIRCPFRIRWHRTIGRAYCISKAGLEMSMRAYAGAVWRCMGLR